MGRAIRERLCCDDDLCWIASDELHADEVRLYNWRNRLTRRPGDYFIHPYARVVELLADAGYRRVHDGGSRIWRVVAFRRAVSGQ